MYTVVDGRLRQPSGNTRRRDRPWPGSVTWR